MGEVILCNHPVLPKGGHPFLKRRGAFFIHHEKLVLYSFYYYPCL